MFNKILQALTNGEHRHTIDYLAHANSVLSAIALFPQLHTTVVRGNTEGVSPTTFFLITLNGIIWVLYGIHRKTPPLIISSSVNSIAAAVIFLFIIL